MAKPLEQLKREAESLLGKFDSTSYNEQRNVARNSYDTASKDLKNSYENLIKRLAAQRKEGRQDFASARNTITENAFDKQLAARNQLASRGLASSGLTQLGDVQNRMATGRAVSDVANDYYKALNKLDMAEREGQQNYNANSNKLSSTLAAQLASISSNQASAEYAHRNNLSNLALKLQDQEQQAERWAKQKELLQLQINEAQRKADQIAANGGVSLGDKIEQLGVQENLVDQYKEQIAARPDYYLNNPRELMSLTESYAKRMKAVGADASVLGQAAKDATLGGLTYDDKGAVTGGAGTLYNKYKEEKARNDMIDMANKFNPDAVKALKNAQILSWATPWSWINPFDWAVRAFTGKQLKQYKEHKDSLDKYRNLQKTYNYYKEIEEE